MGGGVQVSSVSAARLWEPAYLITLSFVTTIIYTSNCSNFKWILNNTTLKVVAVLYCLLKRYLDLHTVLRFNSVSCRWVLETLHYNNQI